VPIDYSVLAISKGTPIELTKAAKDADEAAALRAAYAVVDRRDKGICQATGASTKPFAVDPAVRREHHHIKPRSTHPELVAEPSNIVTLTASAHKLVGKSVLLLGGADANKRLVFRWNRRYVVPGKEPFRLLSKRRSRNKHLESGA
jgi:hypothetical protein